MKENAEYDIPVIKSQRYSIDEIFEKNLLLLIPFYIFSHESRFKKYESDTAMLETLMSEYECIRERLERLAEQKTINEFTKCTILDMANKVLENIAANHEKVREGVKSVMGGQVLEYEAKRIRNEGIKQGIEQGVEQGIEALILDNLEDGKSEEAIVNKLVRRFRLETEDAKAYFDKFAKESV